MVRDQKTLMKQSPPPTPRSSQRSPSSPARKKERPDFPYRNPNLPAEERVKDLLSRMSLEEKAAQMMCVWQKKAETLLDAHGNFDLQKAKASFKHGHGIGQ